MNKSNNPNNSPNTTPSVTEALRAIAEGNLGDEPWQANYERIREIALAGLKSAAMQQPVCADVKRLLCEARSYVEQAGLRHHDVSGLLAEIDAVLLVSNRSGVETGWVNIPEPTADDFAEVGEAVEGAMLSEESWPEIGEIAWRILSRDREVTDWSNAERGKFLDTPTINEGEAK